MHHALEATKPRGMQGKVNASNKVAVFGLTSTSLSFTKHISLPLMICCVILLFFTYSDDATATQSTGHIPATYNPPGMYTRESSIILPYLSAMIDHGNMYITQGKYYEAITCFNIVMQTDPTNIMALIGKGYALERLQKYDAAISYLDKALKIYPNNAYAILFKEDSLYGKAVTLVGLGKYQEAVTYYGMLLKMNPKFDLTTADLKIIHQFTK